MDFRLTEEQEAIRDAIAGICSRFDDSYWLKKDKEGGFPYDFHQAIAEGGWLGMCTPEEYGGAGLGIIFRVFWIHAPRWLYVPLYLVLGYGSLLFIVDFFQANATMMTLILIGGLCYTVGAVIYGLKKPNPIPGVFGFHEIFHTLTVVAFLCHFAAILLIARHPLYP